VIGRIMRLLHSETFELRSFIRGQVPDYVILSHRWGVEELTFDDIQKHPISNPSSLARQLRGFPKVAGACKLAKEDGYDWIWIDSCCINKASSSELQETINSMWDFYAQSNICYVYLWDVSDSDSEMQPFHKSEWFTRGWTLQELIAPVCVEFYTQDWTQIGTKTERHQEIAQITNINPRALVHDEDIDFFSSAERLSWAAHREVTTEEDAAYCLLGLFQVNMPMLYGEGRVNAFIRLQEAIYSATYDESLYLFRYNNYPDTLPLLADSPTRFCQKIDCASCQLDGPQCFPSQIPYSRISASELWTVQAHEQIMTTVTPSRNEMSASFLIIDFGVVSKSLRTISDMRASPTYTNKQVSHVAVLNHTLDGQHQGALCLLLTRRPDEKGVGFQRTRLLPAFLPKVDEFISKLERRKILICPGPDPSSHRQFVQVTFALESTLFEVLTWDAKHVIHQSTVQIPEKREFQIRHSASTNYRSPAEIVCKIGSMVQNNSYISLRLTRFGRNWSIKDAYENRRKQFSTSTFSDRCSIVLSNGMILSVAVRRKAAFSRGRHAGDMSQLRYQIIVRAQ
jgi:Heterokaryon incompatibility protein (HET)